MPFDAHGDPFEPEYPECFPTPFTETCEECFFEAWERMTYGGLRDVKGPGIYTTVDYGRAPYVDTLDRDLLGIFETLQRQGWKVVLPAAR